MFNVVVRSRAHRMTAFRILPLNQYANRLFQGAGLVFV
jgi:hypothetical protein